MRSSKKTIGVLGAGQLALFLNIKAQKQGLKLLTLSPSKEDPATLKGFDWIQGDPLNKKDLKSFLNKVDLLTFESEFFPADLIKECAGKARVAPSLKNLSLIQDRLPQKKLLARHGLPILDFKTWNHPDFTDQKKKSKSLKQKLDKNSSIEEGALKSLLEIGESWRAFVLKTRRGGYDGYGAFVVKNKKALSKLIASFSSFPQTPLKGASKKSSKAGPQKSFKQAGKNRIKLFLPKSSFIVEPLLSFKRELALLAARNQKGQIIFFPLVESFQKNSVCLWVRGPAAHPQLALLKRKIRSFLTKIDYRGVIAFELFETESGGLVVNELAPRVHNTGHYSLDALSEDQFTVHLKAVSNQDLKSPRLLYKEFAMLNLLGGGSLPPMFQSRSLIESRRILKSKGFQLYWYGKKESRPGRKMGHINCVGGQALQRLLKLRKRLKV